MSGCQSHICAPSIIKIEGAPRPARRGVLFKKKKIFLFSKAHFNRLSRKIKHEIKQNSAVFYEFTLRSPLYIIYNVRARAYIINHRYAGSTSIPSNMPATANNSALIRDTSSAVMLPYTLLEGTQKIYIFLPPDQPRTRWHRDVRLKYFDNALKAGTVPGS